jgi:cytochrome c peroxidase
MKRFLQSSNQQPKLISHWVILIAIAVIFNSCHKEKPEEPASEPLTPYILPKPAGFPQIQIPGDNPITVEGVELGRKLFYDNLLSGDNSQSCSSCHNAAFSFTDSGKRFSKGINNIEGTRNAQPLINLGYNLHYFWDGRASTLEKQALEPVPNPIEMHQTWPATVAKLKGKQEYVDAFNHVFKTNSFDSTHVVKALAQFMRTLISYNSRLDRRLRNEINLSASELNGFVIFNTERGDCFHCHSIDAGRLLTDNQFHNNGLDAEASDPGRSAITGNSADRGKFLTPSLRNIALTAPYMHDGRFQTLEEVVDHYNTGGKPSPTVDPLMKHVGSGLNLSNQEKADLVAFLKTFTDSTFINEPKFRSPF